MLGILLRNSGFDLEKTAILPYNGVTSPHLLKPLVRQIKDVSAASIIVHRDRDYLEESEVGAWEKEISKIGAEAFVTSEIDIEGYFSAPEYLKLTTEPHGIDLEALKARVVDSESDDIIAGYVNGRIEVARRSGTIGQLNYGKLGAEGAKLVHNSPFELMKGKKRLAKLRSVLSQEFKTKFEILQDAHLPLDVKLAELGKKLFPKNKKEKA